MDASRDGIGRRYGRRCGWRLLVIFGAALVSLLPVASAPWAAATGPQPFVVACRFDGAMPARYRVTADRARVQRLDVEPIRRGRIVAHPAEYRFIFGANTERFRIVVVIDRHSGNARRVYGGADAMGQPTGGAVNGTDGVVREAGTCEARAGRLLGDEP